MFGFVFFALVVAALVGFAVARPKIKGVLGEGVVAHVLGQTVPGQQYVIHDLLFADEEGHTCQIDHIYINANGVFVIETKNYAGRIYGTAEQREWIQVLAKGRVKNKFYNPIKQNATHIYRLSKALGREGIFHNIVCFSDQTDLSPLEADGVCKVRSLSRIKAMQTDVSLGADEMAALYARLCTLKSENTVTRKQHIEEIDRKKRLVRNGICPRCGGTLVPREGRGGRFLGCSNFPACRFSKSL